MNRRLLLKGSLAVKSTRNTKVFWAEGNCIKVSGATHEQLKWLFWEALERGRYSINDSFSLQGWLRALSSVGACSFLFIQLLKRRQGTQYPGLCAHECTHTHTHVHTTTGRQMPLQMVSPMGKKRGKKEGGYTMAAEISNTHERPRGISGIPWASSWDSFR